MFILCYICGKPIIMSNQLLGNIQEATPETLAKSIAVHFQQNGMSIGIPKESTFQENRVP